MMRAHTITLALVATAAWSLTNTVGAAGTAGIQVAPSTTVRTAAQTVATVSPNGRCVTADQVANWPASLQVGRVLMLSVQIRDHARAKAQIQANGVHILVRGLPTAAQASIIRGLRDARSDLPTLVGIDEEGGRVQHLRAAIGPIPGARAAAKLTPQEYRAKLVAFAKALRAMGFNVVFAPDVDVDNGDPTAIGTNGIGDRSYSVDPAVVVTYASVFIDAMLGAGVLPVVKHFPGHGHANADSHGPTPTTPPWAAIQKTDLKPFSDLTAKYQSRIGVMVAHLVVPGLDTKPASVSVPAVTEILRDQLRFEGLVASDSLGMRPITRIYPRPAAAAEAALRAGNDLLIFDENPVAEPVIQGLTKAVERDVELHRTLIRADLRVLRASGVTLCPGAIESVTDLDLGSMSEQTSTTREPAVG